MAQKRTRKQLLEDDRFVEAAPGIQEWMAANQKTVTQVAVAVLVVAAALAGWKYWSSRKSSQAETLLNEGIALMRPVASDDAPKPADALPKFEAAAEAGGSSPVGLSARYYRAAALVDLDRAAEAIPILEGLGSEGGAISGSAAALLAEAYGKAGRTADAEAAWRKLADADGAFPGDVALYRLGELQAREGKITEARLTWQDVLNRWPQGVAAQDARQAIDRTRSQ